MTKVSVTKSIQVPANAAWSKLAAFSGIEHFSPIARSVVEGSGKGAKRSCFMPDGAEIKEILSELDHKNLQLEYKILSGPFPISNYVSQVSVKSLGQDGAEVTWACTFDTDSAAEADMKNLFGGFYNVIIDSLEKLIQEEK